MTDEARKRCDLAPTKNQSINLTLTNVENEAVQNASSSAAKVVHREVAIIWALFKMALTHQVVLSQEKAQTEQENVHIQNQNGYQNTPYASVTKGTKSAPFKRNTSEYKRSLLLPYK